jgi:uncharacterized membrane protein (UPF0127 family)
MSPRRGHFVSPLLSARGAPCHLVNTRTGDVLATDLEAAVTSESRRRGLLGRNHMAGSAALILAPCGGIHTCFMRFPIDVVCVRKDGRVVKVVRGLLPWRFALSPSAFAVIEWRGNALAGFSIDPGDVLRICREPLRTCSEPLQGRSGEPLQGRSGESLHDAFRSGESADSASEQTSICCATDMPAPA